MIRSLGVDGNWMLHRAFHTQNYESVDAGRAIMQRFVGLVAKDALLAKATSVCVAFDGARIFRYKVYPDYKAQRNKSPDGKSPYDYLDGLMDYLAELGIHTVQFHKYEADDVLCSLAKRTEGKLTVATKDKDAYQYVTDAVTLLDSSAKPRPRLLKYADIVDVFGVPPEQCLDLQTLVGDKIDNIPQLVTRAKALKGLRKWGSLRAWLEGDRELRAQLRDQKAQLALNRKLVKLIDTIDVTTEVPKWYKGNDVPRAYAVWRDFANPKSKGLFA